jgi:hypothetical protein
VNCSSAEAVLFARIPVNFPGCDGARRKVNFSELKRGFRVGGMMQDERRA